MSKSMLLNSSILPSRSEFWFWQVRNTAIEVTKDLYESYPRLGHLIDDFCKNMVRNLLSANPSVSMFPALPKTRFGELSFSANKNLSCVSMGMVLGAGKNDLLLSQDIATIQSSQIMTYVMQAYCQLLHNDSLQKNMHEFQTISDYFLSDLQSYFILLYIHILQSIMACHGVNFSSNNRCICISVFYQTSLLIWNCKLPHSDIYCKQGIGYPFVRAGGDL